MCRDEAGGEIRRALAWAGQREQRTRTRLDAGEAGTEQWPHGADEVGDQRNRLAAVALVTEDRVTAIAAVGDVAARRVEVAPVEELSVAHDVVRPRRGGVALEVEPLDALSPRAADAHARERPRPDAQPADL